MKLISCIIFLKSVNDLKTVNMYSDNNRNDNSISCDRSLSIFFINIGSFRNKVNELKEIISSICKNNNSNPLDIVVLVIVEVSFQLTIHFSLFLMDLKFVTFSVVAVMNFGCVGWP